MLVYLADLRHKTITLTPDAMPLSIGYLAAYGIKTFGKEAQFKMFTDADELLAELKQTRPNVLAMTNYIWNYALHCHILRHARALYPDMLTVMGGPNIPLTHEGEEERLRGTPGLDIHIINEGEDAFINLVSRYMDAGLDKSRIYKESLSSCIFVDPASDDLIRGLAIPRIRELDDIPSPYVMGLMDQFFDGDFSPMVQTNRGCPFTCTFCVEGVSYMTKVNKFSADRIREELEYIGHHTSVGSALMISDSNFGMLPGDMETAKTIHDLQARINWPQFVWATTGKNNKEAVINAMDLMGGSMSLSTTVQSMDPTVLTNIKRTNIKLSTYNDLLEEVKSRNLLSYAEVIIGLPGETRSSFLSGVAQLLDSQVQRVCCYQLMLLDGTEMSGQASREQHGLKTMYRVLSRDFGIYADEPVFELEEVVVATSTMSFNDYMDLRKLQLVMEVYHREGLLGEFLEYINNHDVHLSAYILSLLENLNNAPDEVKELISDYMNEAKNELFETPEALHQAMTEKYQELLTEDLGGNLVQKYSAQAWFKTIDPILRYAVQQAKALVFESGSRTPDETEQVDTELNSIRKHILASMIDITDISNQLEPVTVTLDYDVESWKRDGYKYPLSSMGPDPDSHPYVFHITESHREYLKDKLRMHGASTQAIGKLLSRVVLRDIRRQPTPEPEFASTK